jgi:hypothetical protein
VAIRAASSTATTAAAAGRTDRNRDKRVRSMSE